MTGHAKRRLSLGVFGLGMAFGLLGCLSAPMAIFGIGINDSAAELWAGGLYLATLFPACLLALWRRKIASIWLICLAVILTWGLIVQRHYMQNVRHFAQGDLQHFLAADMLPVYMVLSLGIFGLWAERSGWPRIMKERVSEEVS
jgi:hypothetical protein